MRASRNKQAAGPRGARVQELCRDLNEAIARLRYSSTFNEYVCECRRKSCLEAIRLKPDEYAEIRADRARFVVLKGHFWPAVERVVHEGPDYQVIARLPVAPTDDAPVRRRAESTGG